MLSLSLLWLWLLLRPLAAADNLLRFYRPPLGAGGRLPAGGHGVSPQGSGASRATAATGTTAPCPSAAAWRRRSAGVRLKSTQYVMTFDCCSWPYCNAWAPYWPDSELFLLLFFKGRGVHFPEGEGLAGLSYLSVCLY